MVKKVKIQAVMGDMGGSYVGGSNIIGYPIKTASGGRPKKSMKGGSTTPRVPSAYNMFVKDNYSKASHLPVKERLAFIANLWKNQK